ncbi:type II toxin-antitoxin system VapC family toxin [Candidatus Daviesbacteria bacterium]|nr:type II toxin-antitoxin system VapC family toxin [Candidatus Daviesbacteria bacterium]
MILLDTQALIWWIDNPKKLSAKVQREIEKEKSQGILAVSSISVWEIYLKTEKGKLKLTLDVDSWLEKIESLSFIHFIPVNNKIAAKSVNLPGKFHDDPADRMIVATAREMGAVLVTSDDKIRKYPHIQTIW